MSQRVLLGYFVTLFQSSVNVNIYARFTPVEKKEEIPSCTLFPVGLNIQISFNKWFE